MTHKTPLQIGKRALQRQPLRGMNILITEQPGSWPEKYVLDYVYKSDFDVYSEAEILEGIRMAAADNLEESNDALTNRDEDVAHSIKTILRHYDGGKE